MRRESGQERGTERGGTKKCNALEFERVRMSGLAKVRVSMTALIPSATVRGDFKRAGESQIWGEGVEKEKRH
jgi:hypothetical protein